MSYRYDMILHTPPQPPINPSPILHSQVSQSLLSQSLDSGLWPQCAESLLASACLWACPHPAIRPDWNDPSQTIWNHLEVAAIGRRTLWFPHTSIDEADMTHCLCGWSAHWRILSSSIEWASNPRSFVREHWLDEMKNPQSLICSNISHLTARRFRSYLVIPSCLTLL